MAVSMVAYPYSAQSHQYSYISAPQPPPSPPIEEVSKPSLPSISSLLRLSNTQESKQPIQTATEQRPSSEYISHNVQNAGNLPPTPPMSAEPRFDARHSPSASSQYSATSSFYYPSTTAINNVEPHAQRQTSYPVARSVSVPYPQQPYPSPQYYPSPQSSISSYYSSSSMQVTPPQAQISGLFYQRPLPQNFPPPIQPITITASPTSMSNTNSTGNNPWQHHHYISPSAAASFPQSQDRYVCQTCNKAFSRPSSLRIHSHSHTGEKPFKCGHRGCGKAFSVRSNMKRHERGCHGFEQVGAGEAKAMVL